MYNQQFDNLYGLLDDCSAWRILFFTERLWYSIKQEYENERMEIIANEGDNGFIP